MRVGSSGVLAYRRTTGKEPFQGDKPWKVSDTEGRCVGGASRRRVSCSRCLPDNSTPCCAHRFCFPLPFQVPPGGRRLHHAGRGLYGAPLHHCRAQGALAPVRRAPLRHDAQRGRGALEAAPVPERHAWCVTTLCICCEWWCATKRKMPDAAGRRGRGEARSSHLRHRTVPLAAQAASLFGRARR